MGSCLCSVTNLLMKSKEKIQQIKRKSLNKVDLLAFLLNTDWTTTKGFSAELYYGWSSSQALWGQLGQRKKLQQQQQQPETKLHLSHLKSCPPPPSHDYARRCWGNYRGLWLQIKLWITIDLFFIRESVIVVRLITDLRAWLKRIQVSEWLRATSDLPKNKKRYILRSSNLGKPWLNKGCRMEDKMNENK